VVDKAVLSTADVEALAELPSREILLSQLLGLLLMPATRLVRVLNEPASAFARLLAAKAEKGEPAPAAAPVLEARQPEPTEAPAAEAKIEEAPASPAATAEAAPTEPAPATESTTEETKTDATS